MPTAMAIAAHPDDIEFMMAGTLLALGEAGWRLHCLNVATGSCGSRSTGRDETVAVRTREAQAAAAMLGSILHPPLVDDIEIYYEPRLLARVAAVVRQAAPQALLVPSPCDYMEDHVNASRLAVTAAFTRGMPNLATDPPAAPVDSPVAVYHALPYGLQDVLRRPVRPDFCVDISRVFDRKRRALACHESQKRWLDESQGIGSYLKAMEDMSAAVGRMSGRFALAEGWQRHSHLGFGPPDFDPLGEALGPDACAELTEGGSR
ncbi:MAG: LmbE family protein [Planctomycetes bacterium]|nr:LmbE family protein [Planctomycetota bacterium]